MTMTSEQRGVGEMAVALASSPYLRCARRGAQAFAHVDALCGAQGDKYVNTLWCVCAECCRWWSRTLHFRACVQARADYFAGTVCGYTRAYGHAHTTSYVGVPTFTFVCRFSQIRTTTPTSNKSGYALFSPKRADEVAADIRYHLIEMLVT